MQLAALLALGCVAAGVGLAKSAGNGGVVIERSVGEVSASTDATSADAGNAPEGQALEEPQQETHYVVHVDGAVQSPGVVELSGTDVRVTDAVEKAGGLSEDAETSSINLAEPLVDGAKIHIPHEGELEQPAGPDGNEAIAGQIQTSGATGSGPTTLLVNINTATTEELQTLSGVGEVTAQAIVDERARNGPFASPEDLMRVSGIGEKKFEKVRDAICV